MFTRVDYQPHKTHAMSISGSRDNVFANLLQQGSGVVLFLLVPHILSVTEYSRLTVLSTLFSLSLISDLGISHIYTRKMPGLLVAGNSETIRIWDVSVLGFRIVGALLFGVLAGAYFGIKMGSWGEAVLLVLFFPIATMGAFVTSRCVVSACFHEVKEISLAQSLGRLFCLPGALIAGVSGWLEGQILSGLSPLVFEARRRQLAELLKDIGVFSWPLIRDHATEAFSLCLLATVWTQFMASGRLFAVLHYPNETIAAYGLAGALYQISTSVIIAAFVPQTVRLYRFFPSDPAGAINYAFRIAALGSSVVLLISLLGVFLAPWMFNYLFPKYQIQASLLTPLILSMVGCAVVSAFGSVLIGAGKAKIYLAALLLFFIISMLLPGVLEPWFAYNAAAVSQLISLLCYSLALVGIVYRHFGRHLMRKIHFWITVLPPLLALGLGLFLTHAPA
jgi:O-antigen/teichoic acid export membrane protein